MGTGRSNSAVNSNSNRTDNGANNNNNGTLNNNNTGPINNKANTGDAGVGNTTGVAPNAGTLNATNTDDAKENTGQGPAAATGGAPYQGLPGINADGTPAPLQDAERESKARH
jgi:hypothetical protein